MADAHQKLPSAIKELNIHIKTFSIDLDHPFPPLEKVLKEFVEKNELLVPRRIQTHAGIIANWKNQDIMFLSVEPDYMEELMRRNQMYLVPHFGGDGSHLAYEDKRVYQMSGILKRKKIDLIAEMVYRKEFEMRKQDGCCHCVKQRYKTGETIYINRKDDEKYWFLTNQKTA